MKKMIVLLIAVFSISAFAAESVKELNKRIAVLESKVLKLETENKNLRSQIENKDKAIHALAMRIANKPAAKPLKSINTIQKQDVKDSHDNAEKTALEQQRAQQEQTRKAKLKEIQEKIKNYQVKKEEYLAKINVEKKKIKDAKYKLMKRSEREKIIYDAKENIEDIERQIISIDSKISDYKETELKYK